MNYSESLQIVLEPQVFECKAAVLYKELLFSNSLPQLQLHLAAISKSLVSVLYTLGDAPVIRYYNGAGARDHSSLSAHLALQVLYIPLVTSP